MGRHQSAAASIEQRTTIVAVSNVQSECIRRFKCKEFKNILAEFIRSCGSESKRKQSPQSLENPGLSKETKITKITRM